MVVVIPVHALDSDRSGEAVVNDLLPVASAEVGLFLCQRLADPLARHNEASGTVISGMEYSCRKSSHANGVGRRWFDAVRSWSNARE